MNRGKNYGCLISILAFIFLPIIIMLIISITTWFEESNHNPFDYARIVEVDYRAVVVDEPESYGKVIITERLTFDIHAASRNNLFWELWRELPEKNVDGVRVTYNVLSVKQVFDDGRAPVVFDEAPKLYWDDADFINTQGGLGPGKWFHSPGPYNVDRRQYECVLFYVDGLYRETVVFEIEYEMFNAAMRWADSSNIYLTMYSDDTTVFLRSFKGQVLFPLEIMPRSEFFEAYTFGTNSNGFPFYESTTVNPGHHTFYFELDSSQLRFRPYNRYIEFMLLAFGEDRHIFTQYASENRYFNDNALQELRDELDSYLALSGRFLIARIVVFLIFSSLAVLTVMLALGLDKKMNKKHNFFKAKNEPEFFRDIPSDLDPGFASVLVFCKHKKTDEVPDGYAAVLLSLVRKGYIELVKVRDTQDWNPGNTRIILKNNPSVPTSYCESCGKPAIAAETHCAACGTQVNVNVITPQLEPLTQSEELYFATINRYLPYFQAQGLTLSGLQQMMSKDTAYSDYFISVKSQIVQNAGIKGGYFRKSNYKEPRLKVRSNAVTLCVFGVLISIFANLISYQTRLGFAYGAFFILGLAFIAAAVYRIWKSPSYVLLTQFGEDEYAKWRGLYNFLNSKTLMSERSILDLTIWEKYLVYATAFGLSSKVIKAIELRCSQSSMNTSPVLRSNFYRSRGFYRSSRTFSSATRSASGSFRSGGSSGGGRGGGGGGGGH
ncbi:MAG: DUF2207 domain-containing protein [Oscillospiraceae bacterium]|nr:DUF2207 domain-containing protein [Oscillospiraceae bacterium]